jgi:hypothetical protein
MDRTVWFALSIVIGLLLVTALVIMLVKCSV